MASLRACIQYGAVSAKVHVLKRGLFQMADYLALAQQKTVPEACAYLKNETAYRSVLESVNDHTIHRAELEHKIKTAYVHDAVKLIGFDNGKNKAFYQYIYVKIELDVIKNILRSLANAEQPTYDISPILLRHFSVDVNRLLASTDIPEFLDNLAGSRYEAMLTPLIQRKEHQNLFSIEMTLDMYYYQLVEKLRRALPGALDRKLLAETTGAELDILNLFWIFRCKKYFDLPRELVYSYLIPNHGRITREMMIRLVEAPTVDAFIQVVATTPYGSVFQNVNSEFFHKKYAEYVYHLHQKFFRLYPYSVLAVVSYLHCKEAEISNITTIIEGIRYGLAPKAILPYVIGLEDDHGSTEQN